MLRHGWTLGSPQLMRVLQLVVWTYHGPSVKVLEKYWKETALRDMVVSLVPHFNRALRESFEKAFPVRPFVTVLTDLADYPKHFWIESQPQYLVCGTEYAVEQARELGHTNGDIFRTSGMILHPRFYMSLSRRTVLPRERNSVSIRILRPASFCLGDTALRRCYTSFGRLIILVSTCAAHHDLRAK